ncbi:MAG: hypothetical protein DRI69_04040 [Bacteroidetes bacterium]|nr:MAG: hypothetical protein DRI69_04040 [Bacteroidota bacterium]
MDQITFKSEYTILAILVIVIALGYALYSPDHTTFSDNTISLIDPPQNPKSRAEWWKQITGTEDDRAKIERAKMAIEKQIRKMDTPLYRDAGVNGWDDLGPRNIGGRIRAIAINPDDPTEIFVGGAAGGVWRSTNSGSNWNLLTPTPLSYPVTSIVIDPENTDIIYATTGELAGSKRAAGIGILKSMDGGSSWEILSGPTGANFYWLSKIVMNPLNTDILYAVGSWGNVSGGNNRGMIYKSTDAGATWQILWEENIPPISRNIYDVEINPNDTSELIIGTLRQGLISEDSGVTWSSFMGDAPLIQTDTNAVSRRCELAYCPDNPNTIYMLRYVTQDADNDGTTDTWLSELWQSTNGGGSWNVQTITQGESAGSNILATQGDYDNTLWVDPVNCNRVILGGIDLWKWTNGSLTRISKWQDDIGGNENGGNNSAHADQHIIVEDPGYNGSTNNRVYFGNDGGIYKTNNIWTATKNSGWSSLVNGLKITQLYSVDVSKGGGILIAGAQDNSFFMDHTGNGTDLNWGIWSTGDGGHCAIKKSDTDIMYASTQNGLIYFSSNSGDDFCRIASLDGVSGTCNSSWTTTDNPIFIAPLEMDPNNDDRIFVAGERLFRGDLISALGLYIMTWSTVKSDAVTGRQITTIEIAKGDGTVIWVGYGNGTVAMTTNGGSSWTNVDNNGIGLANKYITDIAINPGNHNEVMVTVAGGYTQNSVYYTDNAGTTWENRSLDFDMLVHSVTWHPQSGNWVYIGTDQGIFASEDDGQEWSITPLISQNSGPYASSEGPIYTPVLELVWQGTGSSTYPYYLVAATHGRGAWRTKAPIRTTYYVDKDCDPCGTGSFSRPYSTFRAAVSAAGSGSKIIFLSGGVYDEVPNSILMKRRIRVLIDDGVTSSVIIK